MSETQVNQPSSNPPPQPSRCVWVCQHQTCLRHGSARVLEAFLNAEVSEVVIEGSGCMGQCSIGPTVRVSPDEIWYYRVQPQDIPTIVEQHLKGGQPVQEKLNPRIHRSFYY